MKTDAIVFEAVNRVGVRTVDVPAIGPNMVLTRTLYSTISPGTELRTLAGREETASPFPLVPGYSTVGEVVETGGNVVGLPVGTRVAVRGCIALGAGLGCSWGGHSGYQATPQEEVFILPDGADPAASTLMLLLATSLHGVDLTQARIREQVAVVGLGLVGQLCARLLNYAGAHVVATDLVPMRRQLARQAGVTVVEPTANLRDAFDEHFPHGAEAVLDATGSSRAMKASLKLLRDKPRKDPCGAAAGAGGGSPVSMFSTQQKMAHHDNEWHGPRLIAQGSYADPIQVDYHDLFESEVGFVVPRVHEMKDIFRALELLNDRRFSLDGLLSRTVRYTEAPAMYQLLRESPNELITVCFQWQ